MPSPFAEAHRYSELPANQHHPWPSDPVTGHPIRQRDLDFIGRDPEEVGWWMHREAPLGMTPDLYRGWRMSLLEALVRDGVPLDQVDVRLRGSGADFYSAVHKKTPTEAELAHDPEALARRRAWLGDDPDQPVARPFDSMHKLGLDEPSDYDLNLSSGHMFERAQQGWDPADYAEPLTRDHGYLNKKLVSREFPHLTTWAKEWTARTGRDMSFAVFDGSGPKDVSELGYFVHFRDSDWIVHRPDTGTADRPPSNRDTTIAREHGAALDPDTAGERRWSQEFGRDIVSDHGAVLRSEEAKTTVIRTITDSMLAPTDRLLAAAAENHVPHDAARHLGDPNRVIALKNSEYPSMGGRLLHRSELQEDNPRHSESNLLNLDSPQADRVLREMAISELVMAWAHDSNGTNVRSLAIQEAAIVEFRLDRVSDWEMTEQLRAEVQREVGRHADVHRELLRIQYDHTQQELSRLGVNNLILYRAYAWPEGGPGWSRNPAGARLEMPLQRPLSSWSSNRRISADWLLGLDAPGVILAARFPREQIVAMPRTGIGCLWQDEFVVLGGHGSATLDTKHEGAAR